MPDEHWLTVGALGLALLIWWCSGPRADFVIRLRQGRFSCEGAVALARQRELAAFLLDELNLTGNVTILGKRVGGRLVLWFRGGLTAGQQQRIRNYLLAHKC
jgi:hypothetical protein